MLGLGLILGFGQSLTRIRGIGLEVLGGLGRGRAVPDPAVGQTASNRLEDLSIQGDGYELGLCEHSCDIGVISREKRQYVLEV